MNRGLIRKVRVGGRVERGASHEGAVPGNCCALEAARSIPHPNASP